MTYDTATQTQPVMLDGEELKVGDEVIIARKPNVADIYDDTLWCSVMLHCVGKTGAVTHIPNDSADTGRHGAKLINVNVPDEGEWCFRLSELSRPTPIINPPPKAATPRPSSPTRGDLLAFAVLVALIATLLFLPAFL